MSYSLEKVPLCGVPFSTPSCRRRRSLCSNKTREERNDIRAPVITGDKRCDYRFPKEGECSEWAGRYVCVSGGVFKRPSGDAFVLGGGVCIHLSYPLEA